MYISATNWKIKATVEQFENYIRKSVASKRELGDRKRDEALSSRKLPDAGRLAQHS